MPGSRVRSSGRPSPRAVVITPRVLRTWPLPQPDEDADKEERGRVLVVGGAPEMPGAVILAATAALRAGAGKLQIATCRDITQTVAGAVPEARVFALPQTGAGGIEPAAAETIAEHANRAQTTLIGPGMVDDEAVQGLLARLLPRLNSTVVVFDAAALDGAARRPEALRSAAFQAILTPHSGEMARMLGVERAAVTREPLDTARRGAAHFGAVVALKGAETYIAAPDGEAYCNRNGNVGLATSGSGDTLSGIIAGLAARGASPLQACAWGVHLHASAGDRLAQRTGQLGFLARELLAEIPGLMAKLSQPPTPGVRGKDT